MTPLIVRNSNEHTSTFDKSKISDSIYTEVNYVANELGLPPQITKLEAEQVALNVENTIKQLNLEFLSGSTIRELASVELLKCGKSKPDSEYSAHRFYKRIGLPIAEAVRIDHGSSDSLVSNSNPVENPETAHKKKADAVSKEEMLLLLPHKLADGHIKGDYHIHDSSYFTTRTFCMDHDLRFFFYYGLDPDCTGKTNIAGPAKNAEVAILHAAKILGSAQTNFAGGQGFYNFLTFLAPYLQNKTYNEIEQLMQMFIYEISQTMVARGAQVVFSSVQLSPGVPTIWKDIPVVYNGRVWDGDGDNERLVYGELEREVRLSFRAFMTVMLQGDVWGKAFNFPKPEIAFQKEFLIPHEEDSQFNDRSAVLKELQVWRPKYEAQIEKRKEKEIPMSYSELYDLVFELTAKFGTPYFDNMIPAYRDTGGIECYQCLHGTEEVILEDGTMRLQDLYIKYANGKILESLPNYQVIEVDEKCLTEDGFKKFTGIRRVSSNSELIFITTKTGKSITCTSDHKLFTVYDETLAKNLKLGDGILTSESGWSQYDEIVSLVNIPNSGYVYDLVEVEDTHAFITGNNIVSSNCCAFSFSADENSSNFQEKLNFTNGQHFSMGAAQVITLNFPRIAYNSEQNNFESLMENTRKLFDDAIQIQLIKRKWTNDAWKNGRIPFASQRMTHPVTREVSPTLVDLDELVYIFGTIGLNEVALHHTGCDLTTPEGKNFTIRYYNHIKAYIEEQSKKYDIQLVLARTPAETTAQRFAVSDLLLYPELTKKYVNGDVTSALQDIHKTNDLPIYYSNGSHLPVDTNVNITEKISTEAIFFTILDGGNIFHIWLGENSPNAEGLKEFTMGILKNTNIGYFTFTKDFTMCKDCKKQFAGLHDKCLSCDSTNVFGISRITGYIQSTENWNAGKKQELKDRRRISNF